MYSVTGQIYHVGDTINWFMEGALERPDGFDLDFSDEIKRTHAASDFAAALARDVSL